MGVQFLFKFVHFLSIIAFYLYPFFGLLVLFSCPLGQLSPSPKPFSIPRLFSIFLGHADLRPIKWPRGKSIHPENSPRSKHKDQRKPLISLIKPQILIQKEKKMSIEVTHEWTGQQWDWPLQHNDGIVKVHDLPDKWEVGIDVAFFTPNEIEVKVVGDHLNIHCKHESRSDEHGSVSREINRSYRLPDTVNTSTIRSHLTQNGVLRVSAQKK